MVPMPPPLLRAKERLQPFLPLLEQFGAVDEHERVHATSGDHRGSRTVLPNAVGAHRTPVSWASIAATAASWSGPQRTCKVKPQCSPAEAFVAKFAANAVVAQQLPGGIEASARQSDVAADSSRHSRSRAACPTPAAASPAPCRTPGSGSRQADQSIRQGLAEDAPSRNRADWPASL